MSEQIRRTIDGRVYELVRTGQEACDGCAAWPKDSDCNEVLCAKLGCMCVQAVWHEVEPPTHKETAARIMQLESVIEQAQSAMLAHIGLCGHLHYDNGCDECYCFHDRTCPARMFLAGMGNPKAWEPDL